jgi:hypothetical protein
MRRRLRVLLFVLAAGAFALSGHAAVTVHASIDPQEVNIGDEATLTYTISSGAVEDFQLPPVDGLNVEGTSVSSQFMLNGMQFSQSYSHTFLIVANRAGNIIIPAFDIHDEGGHVVAHTQAITLHVLGGSSAPAVPTPAGPVIMPPGTSPGDQDQQPTVGDGSNRVNVPIDSDGQQARVFDVITPETTTAYVGEAVPLRIESYIRADANAQQDSLPTLIGSDFLMNNLSLRPSEEGVNVGNMEYIRDSWLTAIEAPRPGDFPLQATRDTYWTKSTTPAMDNDPFAPLFGRRAELQHKDVPSNKLVMHILPLPDQGRPAGFSGAIGKFQISGNATPVTVGVGEPVTLRFTVTGQGNFDYVRAPILASDPAWKPYAASAKTNYSDNDESHTHAMKIFEQAIIPEKNGTLQLPGANFSYFDPDTKLYVSVPVSLPPITVTGEMPTPAAAPTAAAAADTGTATPAVSPDTTAFAPNQLGFGSLTSSLEPAFRHGWFWVLQGILLLVIAAGAAFALIRPRTDPARDLRAVRLSSLRREENAMDEAASRGDAPLFFASARRAVQLRLAEYWQTAPELLTLAEITRRDPALGETVAPLFLEADDVNYSGTLRSDHDLAEWNRRVREMLQPARV